MIQSEFRFYHSTEICRLMGVLQKVMSITATIFHLTDNTDKFWMQTVYTEFDSGTFTFFDNLVLKLFLHFGYHFLNTCRAYTTIGNQLMKSQTANLTANRVER